MYTGGEIYQLRVTTITYTGDEIYQFRVTTINIRTMKYISQSHDHKYTGDERYQLESRP